MCDGLAAEAVVLLHAVPCMRDFPYACARDVVVLLLDRSDDLGQVARAQTLAAVCGEQRSLQVVQRKVAVRASVGVVRAGLVLSQDLLASGMYISPSLPLSSKTPDSRFGGVVRPLALETERVTDVVLVLFVELVVRHVTERPSPERKCLLDG
jgi:hypothetical protein